MSEGMREILFRGKRVDTGEWVYGDHCEDDGQSYIKEGTAFKSTADPIYGFIGGWDRVIPETVGEYTGLDDKNGVKIFEGDEVIANGHQSPDIVYRVPVFHAATKDFIENYSDEFHKPNIIVEVVGNIHDNPELTEVKE